MAEAKNDVAVALGSKAKELMAGMKDRIGREPDVADYAAAFGPLLKKFETTFESNYAEEHCLEKARQRGDEIFSLVGQDITSPAVLCEWIKLNIETAPPAKLRNALERALVMRKTIHRKHAD